MHDFIPIVSGSERIGDFRPLHIRPNAYLVFLRLPGYAHSISLVVEAGETIADTLSRWIRSVTWLICNKPDGWAPCEFDGRCVHLLRSLPSSCRTPLPRTP